MDLGVFQTTSLAIAVLINGNTATDQSIILDASSPDGRTATLENYRLYMNQVDDVAEYRGDYLQITNNLTGDQTTLEPASLTFNGTNTTTLGVAGLTTTAELTLDIGTDLVLNGSLTEPTAGGYSGEFLKLTINGVVYKIQLLVQ